MKLDLKNIALTGLLALASSAAPLLAQEKAPAGHKADAMKTAKMTEGKETARQPLGLLEPAAAPRLELFKSAVARREIKKSYARYLKADRAQRKATQVKSRTKSARYLKSASRGYALALSNSNRAEKRAKNVAAKKEAGRIMKAVERAAFLANLALAEAYTTRGAFRRALDATDRALILRPRDVIAARLKARIQLARAAASAKGRNF
jgi:tetratricopeptide (TPR) repeat protein